MSASVRESVVFGAEELLPDNWKGFTAQGPVRTFNPGLLRDRGGWIFAYRIVGPDGVRRIAICRLNHALGVIAGSQCPLSDQVRFRPGAEYPEMATRWFADPRLYRFDQRIFIYWNSGWHEPRNCQFIQELDSVTLQPRGYPRELILRGERQKLEKNWAFFHRPEEMKLYAVYSILPHRVLEFSLERETEIVFDEVSRVEWPMGSYPPHHGGLRGGAPPCLHDGQFLAFCHSVHDGVNGYRYLPAVYGFASKLPFAPTARPIKPLDFGNQFGALRNHAKLNPAVGEVIYPCGAAHDGTRWLIAHGINDEYCGISLVDHAAVLASVESISERP